MLRLALCAAAAISLFGTTTAHARIFNYQEAGVAAYVRGHWGLSAVKKKPFAKSSGSDTTIDDESNFQYGGEVGVHLSLGGNLSMRLGAEALQHGPVNGVKGVSPTDLERFTLDSSVFVFNPAVTFEYTVSKGKSTRYYFGLGAGMADVTVENEYTMTATGTSDLGVGSFKEKMGATATSFHVTTGLETSFVDNSTFAIDLGYRHLPISELKYKGDVNTIIDPGGVTKGATVYNSDGSKRTVDLSGVFIGMTIRFYLNFL